MRLFLFGDAMKKPMLPVYGIFCILGLSGCATFKTLDADLPLNERVFFYSGTQLDWSALTKNRAALQKMKVAPPHYPLLDLPFSFTLDSLFLPVSVYAEIFH